MNTNTAKKLVSEAEAKASKKVKKAPSVKALKDARKAVDIANPLVPGSTLTLGVGAVRKMREFDRLRVEKDRIEAEMESIKLYFAKQAGTAEICLIGSTGKALHRSIKHVDGYWVKEQDVRQCTIAKAPVTK